MPSDAPCSPSLTPWHRLSGVARARRLYIAAVVLLLAAAVPVVDARKTKRRSKKPKQGPERVTSWDGVKVLIVVYLAVFLPLLFSCCWSMYKDPLVPLLAKEALLRVQDKVCGVRKRRRKARSRRDGSSRRSRSKSRGRSSSSRRRRSSAAEYSTMGTGSEVGTSAAGVVAGWSSAAGGGSAAAGGGPRATTSDVGYLPPLRRRHDVVAGAGAGAGAGGFS